MTTVGAEGFLNMLPVYMEHVLFPTLTEAGYVTEVHHIDGTGEDAGVVYCEMQGRENDADETVQRHVVRTIFPDEKCGYRACTGGILKNLRESTSHAKVVEFHKQFYRPENLCVVVAGGGIKPQDIFLRLKKVEDAWIKMQGNREEIGQKLQRLFCCHKLEFTRPWRKPVAPLTSSKNETVFYPSDEEDNGLVWVAWRGLPAWDLRRIHATKCLMEYLTESSVSPLKKAFVECEDPISSTVDHGLFEQTDSVVFLTFENVPLNKLDQVESLLKATLAKVIADNVDLERMRVIVERRISEHQSHIEQSPHEAAVSFILGDFLYGNGKEDFKSRMNVVPFFESLKAETYEFWLEMLRTILNGVWVVVKGSPSVELRTKMAKDEAERIQRQVDSLGKRGLQLKEAILNSSMTQNEIPVPDRLLQSFRIPSTDNIAYHECLRWDSSDRNIQKVNLEGFEYPGIFVHAKSNFARVWAIIDTTDLPQDKRVSLSLLCELLLESSVRPEGGVIGHEEVIKQLDKDLVSRSCGIGTGGGQRFSGGPFGQYMTLRLTSELHKYPLAVMWLIRLLNLVVVEWERVRTVAAKMDNGLAEMKRDGSFVMKSAHRLMTNSKDSNLFWNNCLMQQKYLRHILKLLESEEGREEVVIQLEELKTSLTNKVVLCISSDFDKLVSPMAPWQNIPLKKLGTDEINQVMKRSFVRDQVFSLPPSDQQVRHAVIGVGALESSFVIRSCHGITDYLHKDFAPLILFCQYLTQLEGPLWCKIRGAGLSYGYGLIPVLSSGRVVMSLTKSTAPDKAFKVMSDVLSETLSRRFEWDPLRLEAAKSSLIFEKVEGLKAIPDVIATSIDDAMNDIPQDYIKSLLNKILAVKDKDLRRVGKIYIKNLLTDDTSFTAVVCRPSKVVQIQKNFRRNGVELELFDNADKLAAAI